MKQSISRNGEMHTNKEIQAAIQVLMETLVEGSNEATDSPYWLIIDPCTLERNRDDDEAEDPDIYRVAHCISGIFFSRKDAEDFLEATRYNYSDKARVYCHSGWRSRKYKAFCKALRIGYGDPIEKFEIAHRQGKEDHEAIIKDAKENP